MGEIHFDICSGGKLDIGFVCRDGHFGDSLYMNMYDYLMRRFNLSHEQAENAVSWCEMVGTVGDVYEEDDFSIEIWEE